MSAGVWRLLGLGAIAFFAAVVVTLPARVAWSWVAPDGVQLHNSAGSVWNGRAEGLSVSGVPLGAPAWDSSFLSLFTGRLAWDVDLARPDGFARSRIGFPIGSRAIEFSDAEAALPLKALQGLFPIRPQDSSVTLALDRLRLEDGWPVAVRGRVSVAEFPVAGLPEPVGPFQADFPDAGDGPQVGLLSTIAGPLDIDGRIELSPDRTWVIEGTAAPGENAPPAVNNTLQALGRPDASGRHPFSLSGSF